MSNAMVTVTLVTFNSGRYITQCLESVLAQDYPRTEVVVVDNASTDDTPEILRRFAARIRIVWKRENVGFAAAQNEAIQLGEEQSAQGGWVLVLNPDVQLMPDFVRMTVAAGESETTVGSVCGKLLRMSADRMRTEPPVRASTGSYCTPEMRHCDCARQHLGCLV